jgi:hypothetical protein
MNFNSIGLGRTIGAGVNLLLPSDVQVSVITANGAVAIYLPSINSILLSRSGSGNLSFIQFIITDISGLAATNNITLIAENGDTINGAASVVLNINNISALVIPTSNNSWGSIAGLSVGGGATGATGATGVTGATGATGTGGGVYNGASPSTVTVNDIPSGTVLTGLTLEFLLQNIYAPYQNPAFTSLSNALFAIYEVGEVISSGTIPISYVVSNAANIKSPQPPNVGVPSTNIPAATFPINPFQLLAGGTFDITIPALTTSSVPTTLTISLQGTNSNNVTFSISNNITFRYRNYWGFNASATLTGVDILALQSSQLRTGFAGTYVMPSNAIPRYLWFVYDNSFGYPATIFDVTNGFNATADFQDMGTIVAPNQFGVSQTWRMIRSVNATAGAGGFNYLFS